MWFASDGTAEWKACPWKSCVVPRPIAWITTLSPEGVVNLAPFSYFNAVADHPPMVMFACGSKGPHEEKDTLRNLRMTRECVIHLVPENWMEPMRLSSRGFPYGVSEVEASGLSTVPSRSVSVPSLEGLPIRIECQLWSVVSLPSMAPFGNDLVLCSVRGVWLDPGLLRPKEGGGFALDTASLRLLARLGGREYTTVETAWDPDGLSTGPDPLLQPKSS
jgi:flavin reductase (DIM6/NTAB) family NADH-FMN oxidoreductase RutF